MSTSTLIPQAFWFRLSVPCPRIEGVPKSTEKGHFLDLPESCRVVPFGELEGKKPWSECRVAWNSSGLALQFQVSGKVGPIQYDPNLADLFDGVQFWIDTRDTRDIHRASRFCHRFSAILVPEKGKKSVGVRFEQRPIHRAQADAPRAKPESIRARAEAVRGGWWLEIFLGAEAVSGFDPETNKRLGFCYQISDADRGDEFLTIGREFPIGEDPSLWSTLELQG